jgi:hypothetical protein
VSAPAPPGALASPERRAEAIRREKLAQFEGRWDGLSAADRARLDRLTRAIVARLLAERLLGPEAGGPAR